jgi:hypothetical protein
MQVQNSFDFEDLELPNEIKLLWSKWTHGATLEYNVLC